MKVSEQKNAPKNYETAIEEFVFHGTDSDFVN